MDFGKILSGAVKVVGNIVGLGDVADKIGDAIDGKDIPPEKALEIQNALLQHEENMKKLAIEEYGKEVEDRINARQREVELIKAGQRDWTVPILAFGIIGGTLAMEAGVVFFGYPPGVPGEVVGRILGTFDALSVMVASYYFGSSIGSKAHSESLNKLMERKL